MAMKITEKFVDAMAEAMVPEEKKVTQGFNGTVVIDNRPNKGREAIIAFLSMVLVLALILFVGKWLWNNVAVDLLSFAKPAKSIWQILGLAVLFGLMYPGA